MNDRQRIDMLLDEIIRLRKEVESLRIELRSGWPPSWGPIQPSKPSDP